MVTMRAVKRNGVIVTDIQVGNRHYGKIKRVKKLRKDEFIAPDGRIHRRWNNKH